MSQMTTLKKAKEMEEQLALAPSTEHRVPRKKLSIGFLAIGIGLFSFLYFAPSSWAGKSLWELRGQTTDQTTQVSEPPKESSQGEATKSKTTTAVTETKPTETSVPPAEVKKPEEINPEIASSTDSIQLPSQYGRVKEKFVGADKRMFVLMQEIHNHPEVQKNNKEIMQVLLDKYGISLILTEGYDRPLLLPNLLAMPKPLREELADYKIERGYYTAEEYLLLTRESPPAIIGVEDEKVIKEKYDLVYFQFVIENRPRAEVGFKLLKQAIESAKDKLYNVGLKALDMSSQEYLEDKVSSEEYIAILNQTLKDHERILSEVAYPNISLVVKGKQAEEQEQFEGSQEYLQKVDHSKLFGEIKQLEAELREQLYKDPKEKELTRLAKGLYYLEKISRISLIPLEWEEYIQEIEPSFTIVGLANFMKENGIGVSLPTDEEIIFLDRYQKEGENLYQSAVDRERSMVENSLAVLREREQTKAILKTGGFHTAAISQFLRNNHISFVVIAPRVIQPDLPTPYWDLMKKSFESLKEPTQGLSR